MHTPQAIIAKQLELANKAKASLFGQHENYEGRRIILSIMRALLIILKDSWSWTNY